MYIATRNEMELAPAEATDSALIDGRRRRRPMDARSWFWGGLLLWWRVVGGGDSVGVPCSDRRRVGRMTDVVSIDRKYITYVGSL